MSTLLLSDLRQNMAKVFGLGGLSEACWEGLLEHADHYCIYVSGGRRKKFPRNPETEIDEQLLSIFVCVFCGRYKMMDESNRTQLKEVFLLCR